VVATSRKAAGLIAVCLLTFTIPAYAVSCLLFPMACLKPKKKYGEEMEALVLNISGSQTEVYEVGPGFVHGTLDTTRVWYIWFKVGETLYQARRDETLLQMGYKPKRDEWVGKTATLRFRDQKWMGLKSAWAVFDRGRGKEWEFVLVSIVGPDGMDECKGRAMCPYQAEVDRSAREQEQLAKVARTGQKSASDVTPMPVDVPAAPAQEAAAPAEPAAPAEEPAADAPVVETAAEMPPA
jgi:hypothetical protein